MAATGPAAAEVNERTWTPGDPAALPPLPDECYPDGAVVLDRQGRRWPVVWAITGTVGLVVGLIYAERLAGVVRRWRERGH